MFAKTNQIGRIFCKIRTKYRFNKERADREWLLNTLLPFVSDKDFEKAVELQLVNDTIKKLQLQFNYWISMFEARYGDILIFYNNFDASNSEKLVAINNLLINLVKQKMSNNEKPIVHLGSFQRTRNALRC